MASHGPLKAPTMGGFVCCLRNNYKSPKHNLFYFSEANLEGFREVCGGIFWEIVGEVFGTCLEHVWRDV